MPIGPWQDAPGVHAASKPSIVDRAVIYLLGLIGGTIKGIFAVGMPTTETLEQQAFWKYPTTQIDPASAADAVQRGVLPGADWEGEAKLSGIDKERFAAMVELAGNPPGPQELLFAWRQGWIDKARLEHGIRQGRTKNEWIDFYEQQRHLPISVAEAVAAAVQNHLSADEAALIADAQGIDRDGFEILYANAGRPPGIMEMIQLWRRGIVDQAAVEQAIRESDVKDKYVGDLLRLADYLPPPRTITTLLSHGAISSAVANDLFKKAGLSPELAQAYVASAVHTKATSAKSLTVSQVTSLYADRILDRATALGDLHKIGFESTEANLILDLADARARDKVRTQAVSRVRSLFVSRKIDRATAESDLAKIGLDNSQAGDLLPLWEVEQSTPSKQLTEAQLVAAYKAGIIDPPTLTDRLRGLGYDEADAGILAALAGPPPVAAPQ